MFGPVVESRENVKNEKNALTLNVSNKWASTVGDKSSHHGKKLSFLILEDTDNRQKERRLSLIQSENVFHSVCAR